MENTLSSQIDSLPDHLKKEVRDFVEFLLLKNKKEQQHSNKERVPGTLKGKITMRQDFDVPLEDFKDYM